MTDPSVTPLVCGSLRMDASVLVARRSGTITAPSLVFLIETDERTLLVDTSFGEPARMERLHAGFGVERTDDQTLRAALATADTSPAAVDAVLLSHLDWDHCYSLDLFDCPIYVQARELAYAEDPYPPHARRYEARSLGRTPPWDGVELQTLDGETELVPGVRAVPTPGHTIGHQSVLVETSAETIGVAVDAVPTFANLGDGEPVLGGAMDEIAWWESVETLRARADRLLPGHEWGLVDEGPEQTIE